MDVKVIIIIVFTIFNVTKCDALAMQKCCPKEYQLSNTLQSCIISESTENLLEKTLLQILNDNISFYENTNNDFNINLQCDLNDIHFENISNNIKSLFTSEFIGKLDFCVDSTVDNRYVFLSCPCTHIFCVNICCQRGYMFRFENGTAACVEAPDEFKNWEVKDFVKKTNEHNIFSLYENAELKNCPLKYFSDKNITVLPDGTLTESSIDHHGKLQLSNYTTAEYCITLSNISNNIGIFAVICQTTNNTEIYVYCTLFFIGSLFLLAILFVYAILPSLRKKVQGLSIMAHCFCMFIGYISFIVIKAEGSTLDDIPCQILAFIIQYFLMSGFFWMSVICMEMSVTFKFPKKMFGDNCTNTRKFAFYCIFANGIPFIVLIITIIMNYLPKDSYDQVFAPQIGYMFCWFADDSYGIVLYFYLPVGLVLLFNFILFIREYFAFNCGRCRSNLNKYTFSLFLKMMMVMGIPWITEIISWSIGGESSNWYYTDAINILRPIPVFIIFCCKPGILKQLKKKLFQSKRQEIFALQPTRRT